MLLIAHVARGYDVALLSRWFGKLLKVPEQKTVFKMVRKLLRFAKKSLGYSTIQLF